VSSATVVLAVFLIAMFFITGAAQGRRRHQEPRRDLRARLIPTPRAT